MMKYSQFNAIIPFHQNFALYNSYTQKFLVLVPELKDLLHAAIYEGIENLSDVHPDFYDYLMKEEFIVGSEVDEVDKVRKLTKEIDENHNSFILTINPTMNCNFKCWYCYETHVKDSKLEVDIITRIKRFISNTLAKKEMELFSLSFFGGEPLLYFNKSVVPVIDYFIAECRKRKVQHEIGFTTNGYLINQQFIDYFNATGIKCSLQITLDGDKNDHDKVRFVSKSKGSYTEIIRNIKLLIRNEFAVRLRINYTDENIHGVHEIADEFKDIPEDIKNKFLLIDMHRVWQNQKVDDTSVIVDQKIVIFEENKMEVNGSYSPNNVINSCYADKRNSAVINYNGDIYKCTARDFLSANRAGYVNDQGELIWENDYLERRMNAKFRNKPCLKCKIMPLCNGGCSQHAMESTEDYCVYQGDEGEKDKVVKSKIEEILKAQLTASEA